MDDLVKYRLDSAVERLKSAKILLDNGQFKDSVGRSYYDLFTAVRAVLALEMVDYTKHAGVISHFQKEYPLWEASSNRHSCEHNQLQHQ